MSGNNVKNLGFVVYLAAVMIAVLHNINLYSQAAQDEYARFFAVVGAVFVGANALVLPVALHNWAVSGVHRAAAIGLYAVDIIVLALNAIVDNALVTGATLPPMLQDYLIYAPATFILPLATWGVLWVLDPGERAKVLERRVNQDFDLRVAKIKSEWLDTAEGRARAQMQAARTLSLGDGMTIDAQARPAPLMVDAPAPQKLSWADAIKYRIAGIPQPVQYAQTVPAVTGNESPLPNSQQQQPPSGA